MKCTGGVLRRERDRIEQLRSARNLVLATGAEE